MEGRGEVTGARVKAKVQILKHRIGTWFAQRTDTTPIAAIQAVNSIVQSPTESVRVAVGHAESESSEHDFPDIGSTITVSVFEINDFRRGSHEHAAIPCANRSGKA